MDTTSPSDLACAACILELSVSLLHWVRPRRRAQRVIAGFASSLFKPWCLCPWPTAKQLLCRRAACETCWLRCCSCCAEQPTGHGRRWRGRRRKVGQLAGFSAAVTGTKQNISGSFCLDRKIRGFVTAKLASRKDPSEVLWGRWIIAQSRVVRGQWGNKDCSVWEGPKNAPDFLWPIARFSTQPSGAEAATHVIDLHGASHPPGGGGVLNKQSSVLSKVPRFPYFCGALN